MRFDVPAGATRCAFYGHFPRRQDLGLLSPTQLLTLERDDGDGEPIRAPEIELASIMGPVDLASVSWATRPRTSGVLGTMTAAFGTNVTTDAFDCPSSPFFVEASCIGSNCRVEYTYPDMSKPNGPPGQQTKAVPVGESRRPLIFIIAGLIGA